MRVSWTQGCGLLALSTAVMVLGTSGAYGQFSPYTSSAQPQQQAAPQPQWQGYAQPSYNNQQQVPAGYAQQPSYVPQQQAGYAQQPTGYAQQQAQPQQAPFQQTQPRYTAMAFQGSSSRQVVESLDPSKMPAQQTSTESYSAPAAAPNAVGYSGGCGTCDSGYNTFAGGCSYGVGRRGYGNQCATGSGVLGAANCGTGRRWFGGVYGLLMDRDNASRVPLAFTTSTANAPPYYPTDTEIALTTRNVDIDFQGGLEFRLGATLGGRRGGGYGAAGCDSCGGGSCASPCGCGPTHAWEAVYWGIFEDDATSVVTDITGDAFRTYGMMDFRGLEYSPDGNPANYRSANVWFDYGPPTVDNSAPYDVEVRSFTTRSTFSAQNLELNLLRLPVLCGGGCGTGACGCGSSRPRYEMTTFVGGRFMRLDEDFLFRTDYERMDTNALGFLAYNVEIDNKLYGVQMGCNGIYHLGCTGRFAIQCSSAVGVYGNRIEARQRMDAPVGGTVRFANGTQSAFNVETAKDDVSIIAELRLGSTYQVNNNWRVYSGWRVLGLTGIALATDQIPTAFITPGQVGSIASSGSMILHGLQAGVEYNY